MTDKKTEGKCKTQYFRYAGVSMAEIRFDRAQLSDEEIKFLSTFLRFEFALKECGFGPENGRAVVEWQRVARQLGRSFYADVHKSGRAQTILQRPPMRQITRDHRLEWNRQDPPTNVQELLLAVRCVRNNLVHGGKSGDPDSDPDDLNRNKRLIIEAQWIIEKALNAMDYVRHEFEGQY